VLRGGWLWDDNNEVTENRILRDPDGLARLWFSPTGPDYFPLKSTWQWLEWQLWGPRPAGYHAASLGLHLLSALLVWQLFRRLGLRWAWLGGLLFAVHPLAVESVAWAAELKNTLSLPLLLLAMLGYLKYDDSGYASGARRRAYLGSLLCFLLAMLAKSSVVMLPAVLLLYAWWKRGRLAGRDLSAAAPFFAVSLALGLVTLRFQQHVAIGGWTIDAGSPLLRLVRAGAAIGFYLQKAFAPAGLSPLYPQWSFPPLSPIVILHGLELIALLSLGWIYRASWGRHLLFGIGFFAINLLPVIGLVPISYMHYSWVADHFAYISIIGAAGLLAAGAGALARTAPGWSKPVIGAAAILAALFALQSRLYAGTFHDSETLWTRVLADDPASWAAHYNLGFALAQAGRRPEGIAHYEAALRLKPDLAEAQNSLGIALAQQGHLPEAIEHLREALRLNPDYAQAHVNLGTAWSLLGRVPEEIMEYRTALRLNPDDAPAQIHLGVTLLQAKRPAEAIPCFEAALRLDPGAGMVRQYLDYARQQAAR
jgi:Flp pilus assembly protein TadD